MEKSEIDKILKSVAHSFRMEGIEVPQDVMDDGRLLLEGKITADELVAKYTERYKKNDDGGIA